MFKNALISFSVGTLIVGTFIALALASGASLSDLVVVGDLTVEGNSELLGDLDAGDGALRVDSATDVANVNSTLIVWAAAGGGAVTVHPDGTVSLPPRTLAPFACIKANSGRFYYDDSEAFCFCDGNSFTAIGAGSC